MIGFLFVCAIFDIICMFLIPKDSNTYKSIPPGDGFIPFSGVYYYWKYINHGQ